jgi:hypothetical protein
VLAVSARAAAPRYHPCGEVSGGGVTVPVYASQVSCSKALAVERRCRFAPDCFGQLPMVNKDGSFFLPNPAKAEPFGFRCWQIYGAYQAGLPSIPRSHEASWILCGRFTGSGSVFYTQFVAFWSQ